MPTREKKTDQIHFRAERAFTAQLDYLASCLSAARGQRQTRTDAIYYAVSEAAKKMRKKNQESC